MPGKPTANKIKNADQPPGKKANHSIVNYLDFVITATRTSAATIEVDVYDSPAGKSDRPTSSKFSRKVEQQMHQSFFGTPQNEGGQMRLQKKEAVAL